MASVMSSFQRKAHKLLVKNGWVLRRFTGSGHTMYEKMVDGTMQTTVVSSSPKNPTDALRAVSKYAKIKV